ncbi:MAG: hypothetical protein OQK04_19645 [Kangiellaceae bacterium]|nr:hypothetical protein [Kangiellaceae bacterium]MCW9000935.1 hypothetical protein [Kangiellaceae bacterium]
MVALIASIFSLFVGPLVYQTFGPLRRTDKIVGGIVLSIVSGIIIFQILPNSFESIGIYAIVLALLGFAGPTLIESSFRQAADQTHRVTIYLGIFGLLVHALVDGAAIQGEMNLDSSHLTLAILIHRIPVGLTIWWLLKPILGERFALIMLVLMGAATYAGFSLSQLIGQYDQHFIFGVVQSLVAGSLLHVVIYKPHSDGCMHTSSSHHEHKHNGSHHHNNRNIPAKVKEYVSSWDFLGFFIGLIILILMLSYQH